MDERDIWKQGVALAQIFKFGQQRALFCVIMWILEEQGMPSSVTIFLRL